MKTTTTKTTTKKTAKKTKTTKKAVINTDAIHRVWPLPEATRDVLKAARAEHGTNLAAASFAIHQHLPTVLRALADLGIGSKVTGAKTRKYRLPLLPEDMEALASASDETGLPATFLFKVCLASLD
jgi:hypothetical protein